MKFPVRLIALATGVLAVTTCLTAAQGSGMRMGMRMYDPSTEITLKGTVEDITNPTRGAMMGTHLSVKTADGVTMVALGPAPFIESSGFVFAKGDTVQITGSKVKMGWQESMIAREVVKDGKTLTLRDKNGIPKWRRGMTGGMMRKGAAATQ